MFVESNIETTHNHKNGLAIRQRRGKQETLVQWENGRQRWVMTADLKNPDTIRVIGSDYSPDEEMI
jgi:hypothetical protein